jgi:hypothetical protein
MAMTSIARFVVKAALAALLAPKRAPRAPV